MKDYKKYLPSKSFTAIILFILVIIILIFTTKNIVKYFHNKKIAKNEPSQVIVTVDTITQKDSNDNGIPDWEEYLWGLNPSKNGEKNKEFINEKKKTLTDSGVIITDNKNNISDNEMLSRQFFATIVALQQTGELDQESINSVADSVGQNITTNKIEDIYIISSLDIVDDSPINKKNYNDSLKKLVNKYINSDIGNEMTLIAQGLSNNDKQALYAARSIAQAYKSFGLEFVKLKVPRSFVSVHLSVANNYEKVGQAIDGLIQMLSDPIIGMKSIVTYKNYNDLLSQDLERLSDLLQ